MTDRHFGEYLPTFRNVWARVTLEIFYTGDILIGCNYIGAFSYTMNVRVRSSSANVREWNLMENFGYQ